ncbi:MAG: S9 family peptidase [Planctomycetota bacterium]|jgi:dipeptidyl aminopeptidase/acylaminoacyl peptidase
MSYIVKPSVGDGVLHVRQVDGDKSYSFERGQNLSFSNDNKLAFFKVGKSVEEERMKKLKKLHEKKEEKKEGEAEEEETEGIPPDIKAALAERGISEEQAAQMMAAQGNPSWKEVRGFLGLPDPGAKGKQGSSGGGKKEDPEDKEAKALKLRLHVLDLKSGKVKEIERVKNHKHPKDSDLLIMHMEKPEPEKKEEKDEKEEKKAGEKKAEKTEKSEKAGEAKKGEEGEEEKKEKEPKDPLEKKRKDGTDLVIHTLSSGKEKVIPNVLSYGLVSEDSWMWYSLGTKKAEEGVEHGLYFHEFSSNKTVTVLSGYSNVSGVRTDKEHTRLAFTSDLRTFDAEEKDDVEKDIYLWDFSDTPARVAVTSATAGIPEDFRIQSGGLGFSQDGSVLSFGVKPPKPEDLPKILDDDKVNMDLWHYQDGLLQTMQAKRPDPAVATLSAVYHEDGKRALVLGTTKSPSVRLITADGSRALTQDNSRYEKMISWDGRYQDYYLVNTIDGSRQMIIEGLRGSASSSPDGRFVVWFDHRDYHWHAHDVATGKRRNLTAQIGVAFDREIDDRPEPHRAHGLAGWMEDGTVLLNDEYDVWAVNAATGVHRCVTDGLGRATKTAMRLTRTDLRPDATRDDDEDQTYYKGTVILRAVNQETYAQGYYSDSLETTGRPKKLVMVDKGIGGVNRPADADRLFMSFSRFDQYPDLWTADLAFANPKQLTSVGKVVDEFRWGEAELVNWKSDDGVDLKGYLVKPDGFDPKKQYPMMVYFYERSSQGIHRFVTPATGTSPNASFYVSRGYLWFVPDIVYTEGYPGESAEKCVISGVQHLLAKGFVDRDAIGMAGHSWGGYQTAHLITRTDLFAAAESGAPVVNMFSAYGGIRWSSGMTRQFQYEQTQSRIGKSIWEAPMRYWENSPLFHLDKANTPVIILHNDKDGAVPWYQGIEFFVAMRRLGKEAYLMNYNDEDHGLRKAQNKRDWTRRMQGFFDHHLKGAPAPEWMQRGVPYHERVAEKIPNAPSYQEALEAGLIKPEASKPPVGEPVGSNGSSGNK